MGGETEECRGKRISVEQKLRCSVNGVGNEGKMGKRGKVETNAFRHVTSGRGGV